MKKKKSFLRPTNQVFTTSKMFSKMKRSVKSKNSTELCKIDSLAVIDALTQAVAAGVGDDEVEALLPVTGGLIFFDSLAILKDAKHPNNAHTFVNYFLRPEVSAALTNELGYPTVNQASLRLVEPGIAADKAVFPDQDNLQKMVLPNSFSNDARQSLSQVFTRFKKGS
jgi:spermidine/putrescine-binding protein